MQINESLWPPRVHKHFKSEGFQGKKNLSFPPGKSPLVLGFTIAFLLITTAAMALYASRRET